MHKSPIYLASIRHPALELEYPSRGFASIRTSASATGAAGHVSTGWRVSAVSAGVLLPDSLNATLTTRRAVLYRNPI